MDDDNAIYITRWALTQGILRFTEGPFCTIGEDGWVCLPSSNHGPGQWFRKKEEAIAKAEKMKAAKIKSLKRQLEALKKQLETLEALEF